MAFYGRIELSGQMSGRFCETFPMIDLHKEAIQTTSQALSGDFI